MLPHGVAVSLRRRHQKTVTGTAVKINVHAQVKAEKKLKKARWGDPVQENKVVRGLTNNPDISLYGARPGSAPYIGGVSKSHFAESD